jgi:hypothetical protein
MLTELTLSTVLTTTSLAAVPGAVYLWSKDEARRRRAWRLLRLIRRR